MAQPSSMKKSDPYGSWPGWENEPGGGVAYEEWLESLEDEDEPEWDDEADEEEQGDTKW